MKIPLCLLLCLFFFQLSTQKTLAQNQIPFSVISSGGEKLSSVSYILTGTLGETFIGKLVSAVNYHYIGFWDVFQQDAITSVRDEETIPNSFKLEQNYPNPFNPSTIIKFGVPERSYVIIKIYDLIGSEVITLVNGEMEAGWYKNYFNANGYSSGIYIYRMQAGNYVNTKKMILIK